jgi:peptidoglycan/xylan/chitin deacetylase (PgdA/CDA1 family)
MKRILSLTVLLTLLCAPSAIADPVPFANAGAEDPVASGDAATGWSEDGWGTSTRQFTRPGTGAHSGSYSLRVDVTAYTDGDAKWMPTPVPVTGAKHYVFSDFYKSDTDSAAAMFWQTAAQVTAQDAGRCEAPGFESVSCGTWANLERGIEPSAGWKRFESAIDMPDGAVRASFAHFIAGVGFLQTDDYALERLANPAGFRRPLVTLTFDDSTPNLYDYVIPELDKVGYKSTQYVVTGATGARDDNGVLFQWSAEQIADVHRRGHEIGSHTEFHPDLSMPGPSDVCMSAGLGGLPVFTAPPCQSTAQRTHVAGSWRDPAGGAALWLRPATVGTPGQALADTTLAQELESSKTKLEGEIGYGVPTLAYPFGAYSSAVITASRQLGYKAARTVDEGFNSRIGLNPFKIKVQNVQQAVCTDTATGAVTKAGGTQDAPTCKAGQSISADVTAAQFTRWVQQAKDGNYWLVLVYHSVDDLGVNPYGTSRKRFAAQLQAIKNAGVEVRTMRDALNEVMPQVGPWERLPSPAVEVPPGSPAPGPIPGPDPGAPSDHVAAPAPSDDVAQAPRDNVARPTDAVRPTIRITSPTRRVYRRGRRVVARFKCSDDVHVARCRGTVRSGARINTRKRGRKRFTVVATDAAGNVRRATIRYRVR